MILAVTGLAREANIVSRPDIVTVVGGGNAEALRTRIHDAVESGARRVLSIGICGALSPALKVGDCVVAKEVVTDDERLETHPHWVNELLSRLPGAKAAGLAGIDYVLADSRAKARLHETTGAAVVDMESHIAARTARAFGLPFAAVRVVSDSSRQTLPPAAMVAMSEDGGVDIPAVARSLVRQPGQIPALIRTAWEAEKAFRALFRCRHVLDPALVPVNLGELSLDMG